MEHDPSMHGPRWRHTAGRIAPRRFVLVPDVLANAFDADDFNLYVTPHSRDSGRISAEGDAAVDDKRDHTERDELPVAHYDREHDEGKDDEV